jgi:hypothetical protein
MYDLIMKARTTTRALAALVGAALLAVLAAPLAGAQTDPYGSTTTTAPGEVEAACTLSVAKAKPGEKVTAKVTGVFFGEKVRILFDDLQVAEVTAPAVAAQSAAAPVALGGQLLAQAADSTTVTVDFLVPKSAAVGTHIVTAVGDTFTCLCNPRGEFTVLAASKGSLARTGVEIALVLVVAAALLLVGRTFVSSSRRRRRGSLEPEQTFSSVGR